MYLFRVYIVLIVISVPL